jgi:Peptidase A4 family
MAIWTGLGGYDSGRLIQSGIEAGYNFGGPTVWQPFWEVLGPYKLSEQQFTTSMAINPGNVMWSKTTYSAASNGSVRFFIENDTTGKSATFDITSPSYVGNMSTYYTGNTADFITEDPDTPEDAIPFSSFAFVTANTFGEHTQGINGDNPEALTNSRVSVGPITGSAEAFAVGWGRCPT